MERRWKIQAGSLKAEGRANPGRIRLLRVLFHLKCTPDLSVSIRAPLGFGLPSSSWIAKSLTVLVFPRFARLASLPTLRKSDRRPDLSKANIIAVLIFSNQVIANGRHITSIMATSTNCDSAALVCDRGQRPSFGLYGLLG